MTGAEMYLVVEHDGEAAADILGVTSPNLRAPRVSKPEVDDRLVGLLVERRLRVGEVLAGHQRRFLDDVVDAGSVLRRVDDRSGRGGGACRLARCVEHSTRWNVSCAVWPTIAFSCAGSSRPGAWTRMRSLALALDGRLGRAERVDAAVDDLDRLLDDAARRAATGRPANR